MKKGWVTFLMVFAIHIAAFSQSADVEAWIKSSEDTSGLISFTGYLKNLTVETGGFTYKMKITKADQNGKSSNTQSGSVTLDGDGVEVLSTVQFNKADNQLVTVELVIRDLEQEVARISRQSDSSNDILMDVSATKVQEETTIDSLVIEQTTVLALEVKDTIVSSTFDDLEIDGLIINETRSKSGRDFYNFFYKKWQAPENVHNYSITFKESPTRGRVARVGVEVNGNLVFQPVLQARQDVIEMSANQAISIVKNYLLEQSKIKNQLESGDQSGSGLF